MPPRKPSPPVLDTGDGDASTSDALALAEQAEAEAVEAEAAAAAARARARAIRLRNEAEESAQHEPDSDSDSDSDDADPDEAVQDADPAVVELIESTSESTAEDTVEEKQRRRLKLPTGSWWKYVAVGVSSVLTLALLAASGYMVWHHRQVQADQQRSAEFAAAARQGVVTLMSLDFNHAKEDVQRIIDSSTGQFKSDFEDSAEDFAKVATDSKVITEATVNSTAVDSMTDDSAVVLVAATSHITNVAGAKQDPRNWRLSVSVTLDGDQIKMSKVEFVP